MTRLGVVCVGIAYWSGLAPSARAQQSSISGSSQAPAVRTPRPIEVSLLQALRANPATAPFPFSTEPRGSKIILRGRVGAKIVHDVAVRMAIDLGAPVIDAITIDTGFNPGGRGGFGTVPGPGPTTTGGYGFGGPPSFGYAGIGAGGYAGGMGGYGGGGFGGNVPAVMGFPSAGSYGGAPSLIAPPIFGRYDDPFYGFDPPAVVYPPWWGALNAQRVQSNSSFNGNTGTLGAGGNGAGLQNQGGRGMQPQGLGPAPMIPTPTNNTGLGQNDANVEVANTTNTDIGPIPDGTIDMAIDGSGVATIRGGVPSQAEKLAIGQRVAQITGVSQVVNLLTIKASLSKMNVSESPPPPPVPVEASVPPPVINPSSSPAITSKPAGATPNSTAPAANPASDTSLTDRASRALTDRAASIGSPVRVKVRNGEAQISGKLASVYEAMLAYRTVQQIPGIRSIDDRLEFTVPDGTNVNPLIDKGRPDDVEPYLEAQIRRQAGNIAHIDRVRILGESLDLRGTLDRAEDRDRFDAILRSMPILRGFQVHADLPGSTP